MIKILITEVSSNGISALIEKGKPIAGAHYILEDAVHGTQAQNKAFHALLNAFWNWMFKTDTWQCENQGAVYNFATPNKEQFREYFKLHHGAGMAYIRYVSSDFKMVRVNTLDEIPPEIIKDFNNGNRERVLAVVKSWSDYTVKQRKNAIDNLIRIIALFECDDKKVHEIIGGMEK